ncbi:MAG: lamin tail domain-containing protein, partial [Calditrichia bacterium]|nr:lamin tail domain-containing protein [Calditrichia bacterium]
MFIRAVVIIIILILSFTIINGQNVVINEVMSSNSFTIIDEDGDYPDWIELYNYGTTPIDLNGFGLSDDITEPLKWTFPQVTIQPDDYLLLFASDKNRINVPNIWETVIDWGDIWKYRLGLSEPPTNWNTVEYDDLSWDEGPSGFGYGDEDDATEIAPIISVYVRKSFTISDTANIILAVLHV